MKEEVHCACEFFSKMLESKHLPHQFATQFRLRLEELLSQRFKDHWDTKNPSKGSAYRCIRINSKMDPIVSEAAKVTGLRDISKYLPAEFTMWIDPRDVSYRFGEDGSICSCPLDFMITRSEWSSTSVSATTPTVSSATARHRHHYQLQPSRSKSSPESSQSSSYYQQVYRNWSNRLVQVQV
jgi:protein Tob/BTG